MPRAPLIALGLLVLVAACGDDADDPDAAPASSAAADEWCDVAQELNEILRLDDAPSDLEGAFRDLAAALDDARAAAPGQIADDVDTVAGSFDEFIAELEASAWDPASVTEARATELSAAVDPPLQRIDAYNEEQCGLRTDSACAADLKTLEVAVEAFNASEGRNPASQQELVDAGFLREPSDDYDVSSSGVIVVVAGGDCD